MSAPTVLAHCRRCQAPLDKTGPFCEVCSAWGSGPRHPANLADRTVYDLLDQLEAQLSIVVKALQGAQAEKDAAVVAERERCAKIAEVEWIWGEGQATAELIAARIREGK
jgi:hypothetical protein